MGKSTVYFTDFRCPVGTSQLDKLKKVCLAAGIKNIDMDGKFVAIKMHFGEAWKSGISASELCKGSGRSVQGTGWRSVFDGLQHPLSRQPQKCAGAFGLCKFKRL